MQLQTETQNVVYEIQKIEEQPIAECSHDIWKLDQ